MSWNSINIINFMEFNYSTFMPAFLIWFIKSTGLSESNGNAFNLIKNRSLEWICKLIVPLWVNQSIKFKWYLINKFWAQSCLTCCFQVKGVLVSPCICHVIHPLSNQKLRVIFCQLLTLNSQKWLTCDFSL